MSGEAVAIAGRPRTFCIARAAALSMWLDNMATVQILHCGLALPYACLDAPNPGISQ